MQKQDFSSRESGFKMTKAAAKNITPIGQNFGWVVIDSIPRPFLKYSRISPGRFTLTLPSGEVVAVDSEDVKSWPCAEGHGE